MVIEELSQNSEYNKGIVQDQVKYFKFWELLWNIKIVISLFAKYRRYSEANKINYNLKTIILPPRNKFC